MFHTITKNGNEYAKDPIKFIRKKKENIFINHDQILPKYKGAKIQTRTGEIIRYSVFFCYFYFIPS